MAKKKTSIIKAKLGDTELQYEVPNNIFHPRMDESPHIHHSKPHPSTNDKQCDLCGKMMVKHYHICEDCWKFMKESLILKIRELEDKISKLEKRTK